MTREKALSVNPKVISSVVQITPWLRNPWDRTHFHCSSSNHASNFASSLCLLGILTYLEDFVVSSLFVSCTMKILSILRPMWSQAGQHPPPLSGCSDKRHLAAQGKGEEMPHQLQQQSAEGREQASVQRRPTVQLSILTSAG